MYENNIDIFRKKVGEIKLSESLNKDLYESNFYAHLGDLWSYFLKRHENVKSVKITKNTYLELQNYAIETGENSDDEINWDFILDAKDVLEKHIKLKLGKERDSTELRPFINSTVDSFENWVLYGYTHKLESNPWDFAFSILQMKGCLHHVTDDEAELKYYRKDLAKNKDEIPNQNMSVIAAANKFKKSGESNFSGIVIDNRLSNQTLVYNFLITYANGKQNAKNMYEIRNHLIEIDKEIDENILKNFVLLPLKRQGLIGSCNSGYYHISSIEDLTDAFEFHLDKVNGIVRTLKIYANIASLRGDSTLNDQLSHYLNNLNNKLF